MTFTTTDYALIRDGIRSSAASLVPKLIAYLSSAGLDPTVMVDVGCGEGWWAAEFANQGVNVFGVDGAGGGSAIPYHYGELDLSLPFELGLPFEPGDSFDLALSLEVAEHLPPERAAGFVDDLCALAPVVVFSAAIPGQGGQGHVHEKWQDYWAGLFNEAGLFCSGQIRHHIWDDDSIEHWYRQNLMVAWRPGILRLRPERVQRLVHPRLWAHYRNVWESL